MKPVLLLGCFGAMALLGVERSGLPLLLLPWTAAFLLLAGKVGPSMAPRAVLGWAAAFRLPFLLVTPDLSDDHFRYLWDGVISLQGASPYAWTPVEAAAMGLGDPTLLPLLNSPEFHSVYPPLSQLAFLLPAWAVGIWGWEGGFRLLRLLLVTVELGGLALLLRVSRSWTGGPLEGTVAEGVEGERRTHLLITLYAWNPLVVLAVAGSGHTEALLIPGMALLALGIVQQRRAWAWGGLALAGMVKLIPFALAPFLLRWSVHGGRGWWKAPLGWGLVCLALAAPFWTPGTLENVRASLDLYVRFFEYNAGLYFLLKEVGWRLWGEDPSKVLGPLLRSVFVLGLLLLTVRWPIRTPGDWLRGATAALALYLVCATTVHPWYLLWLLPLAALVPFASSAWVWVGWASLPTYLTYLGVPHLALTTLFWGGWAVLMLAAGTRWGWPRLLRWAGGRKARILLPHLTPGTLLDVGSGEGWVAQALAETPLSSRGRGAKWDGIILTDRFDFSEAPLPFVQADGSRLPFRDGAFHAVLLSLTLHHMADPEQALREAGRVASHRVLVTESCYRSTLGRRILLCLDGAVNRFRGHGAFLAAETVHLRRAEEWESLYSRAGLEVVERKELNRFVHHWVLWELSPRVPGEADPP